jgi:DNA-binding cell septation regulator SpoVG
MPREQGKNGQWYDTVAPLTPAAKERLAHVVLEAYSEKEPSGA